MSAPIDSDIAAILATHQQTEAAIGRITIAQARTELLEGLHGCPPGVHAAIAGDAARWAAETMNRRPWPDLGVELAECCHCMIGSLSRPLPSK